MSQMGMQMPGRRRARAATVNVYTGLMLASVACLGFAVAMTFMAGQKIGPDKGLMGPFHLHPEARPGQTLRLPD